MGYRITLSKHGDALTALADIGGGFQNRLKKNPPKLFLRSLFLVFVLENLTEKAFYFEV